MQRPCRGAYAPLHMHPCMRTAPCASRHRSTRPHPNPSRSTRPHPNPCMRTAPCASRRRSTCRSRSPTSHPTSPTAGGTRRDGDGSCPLRRSTLCNPRPRNTFAGTAERAGEWSAAEAAPQRHARQYRWSEVRGQRLKAREVRGQSSEARGQRGQRRPPTACLRTYHGCCTSVSQGKQ